ncbi:hypothetical protein [Oceanisphaera sp. KMM 10153]|uniref:hypothetical protein n=1 Tax=Oceanisphaera submarina TaxID=3390193 RepID=UPI00397697CE
MDVKEVEYLERGTEFKPLRKPSDYYQKVVADDGTIIYRANRPAVRELANARMEVVRQVALAGGNVHTAGLDLSDQVEAFFMSVPPEALAEIYGCLAQEMEAIAATLNEEADKVEAEVERQGLAAEQIGTAIGAVILFSLVFFFLSNT